MVQLQAKKAKRKKPITNHFQFLHGTITSKKATANIALPKSFNSFMVQLQDVTVSLANDVSLTFQFLHGTITSIPHPSLPDTTTTFNSFMVQLQAEQLTYCVQYKILSIPSWYNYKSVYVFERERLYTFSIPSWYNYKGLFVSYRCLLRRLFNSFMVQLQGKYFLYTKMAYRLSIPSWYNYKIRGGNT